MMRKIRAIPVAIFMVMAVLAAAIVTNACTEQMQARTFGGEADIDIPCGQKLIMATWKENNLWLLTRPWQDGDAIQKYTLTESSSWGIAEGIVHLKECSR